MKNTPFFLFAILLGFLFISCEKEEEHSDPVIVFVEPKDEEVVANPENLEIHIQVTGEEEVHDVEIKMHPENDENDLIIDQDAHSHETIYEFIEFYDLSAYPSGTRFHLSVEVAKDHEGTEFVEEDITFQIP